jgi:hypothetical protein
MLQGGDPQLGAVERWRLVVGVAWSLSPVEKVTTAAVVRESSTAAQSP